ncbi:Uncharacterised protein [Escherichia coli]|nr:Uncharacterised protein [Escherichia coli]
MLSINTNNASMAAVNAISKKQLFSVYIYGTPGDR